MEASIDERIAQAERSLIARDHRVVMQARAISELAERKLHAARQPGMFKTVLGTLLSWWLPSFRRRGTRSRGSALSGLSTGRSARGLSWAVLLPLMWPLMPSGVRRRISAPRVAMIATFAGPALASLRSDSGPVQTVEAVDLERYAGLWYEIARLPSAFEGRFDGDATATYTPRGQHLEVDKRSRMPSGRERQSSGVAHPVDGTGGAQMEVSMFPRWLRWLPVAWEGQWVIAVDSDYQTAVVGAPGRGALCLLSRSPVVDEARYRSMVASAAAQGYNVGRLKRVQHRVAAPAGPLAPDSGISGVSGATPATSDAPAAPVVAPA